MRTNRVGTTPDPANDARVIPLPAARPRRAAELPVPRRPGSAEVISLPGTTDPAGRRWTDPLAEHLAFIRRRLLGDYPVDEFGFDPEFTDHLVLPLLRPLYRRWFRVRAGGLEHLPGTGGALVVANHSGTLPLDALMTALVLRDEHPAGRHLRILGAELLFRTPALGTLARKTGHTLACQPDALRLLGSGELVGVWPEGFTGIGKPFSDRYQLRRFGRGGFVAAAIRTGTPIIPCSIVGAEEIYPMIADLRPLARLFGLPYFPITPTFPLLGPLGAVPLPSKWLIEFGEPVPTGGYDPADADDPALVFDIADKVRESIQHTLCALVRRRRNVFVE